MGNRVPLEERPSLPKGYPELLGHPFVGYFGENLKKFLNLDDSPCADAFFRQKGNKNAWMLVEHKSNSDIEKGVRQLSNTHDALIAREFKIQKIWLCCHSFGPIYKHIYSCKKEGRSLEYLFDEKRKEPVLIGGKRIYLSKY